MYSGKHFLGLNPQITAIFFVHPRSRMYGFTPRNHYPDIYRPEITCSSQVVTRDPHELSFLPEITGSALLSSTGSTQYMYRYAYRYPTLVRAACCIVPCTVQFYRIHVHSIHTCTVYIRTAVLDDHTLMTQLTLHRSSRPMQMITLSWDRHERRTDLTGGQSDQSHRRSLASPSRLESEFSL